MQKGVERKRNGVRATSRDTTEGSELDAELRQIEEDRTYFFPISPNRNAGPRGAWKSGGRDEVPKTRGTPGVGASLILEFDNVDGTDGQISASTARRTAPGR